MNTYDNALTRKLREFHAWTLLLICFAVGALAVLSFAPYYYWFAGLFALPVFYLILEGSASRAQAIARGFFFGYGHVMAGTYWISNALLVDADKFAWLIPFTVFGLSALFALWFALFGLLFWWHRSGDTLTDVLRFAVLWVVVEYLRSIGIFGFPWNLAGYAALAANPLAQLAAVTGTYGLSLLLVLAALLPALWLRSARHKLLATQLVLCLLVAAYAYGYVRAPHDRPVELSATTIRLVQPNIAQSTKWTPQGRLDSLNVHAELTKKPTESAENTVTIWSETALAFTLYDDSPWPSRVAELLPKDGTLITGVVRADDSGPKLKLWNSLIAVGADGEVAATYDKHQLVPFGEFVPLREALPLDKITPGDTDFSRGQGVRTLHVGHVPPFSPLICYEIIFPWLAASKDDRPDWIVNITNDAWYGESSGPYQHFAAARMRAIEQGLPVARVANTGITGVLDPYGRLMQYLPLGVHGAIDQLLPKPLPPTVYARYGEWITLLLLIGLWTFTFWTGKVRKS